jgi:hypothetical protein
VQQHIDKKISKEKKKLKKSYEQQFNQMFHQDRSESNVNYIDPAEQEYYDSNQDLNSLRSVQSDDPSGIESDASSSHSDTMENGRLRDIKILDNDYRCAAKSGIAKRCRG